MGFQVTPCIPSPTEKWGTPQGQPSTPISEQHLASLLPLQLGAGGQLRILATICEVRNFVPQHLPCCLAYSYWELCGKVAILPRVCTAHDTAGHSHSQGPQTVQLCINEQLFQVPKTVGVSYIITFYQVLTKCHNLLIEFLVLLCQFLECFRALRFIIDMATVTFVLINFSIMSQLE